MAEEASAYAAILATVTGLVCFDVQQDQLRHSAPGARVGSQANQLS